MSLSRQTSNGVDAPDDPAGLRWMDPRKVNLVVEPERRRDLQEMDGRVLDGDWDTPRGDAVEDLVTYKGLRDRIVLGKPWEQTDFYRSCVASIEAGNPQWNCTTERAFREACAQFERLYHEIRERGYKTQAELGTGRPDHEIRVGVRRDGRLLFITGRRRFCIARLLGLPAVPARVVVRHADWEAFRRDVLREAAARGGRLPERIDHPDLAEISSERGEEATKALRQALCAYEKAGKRLLDIGAGWGQRCQQMEDRGFVCTALERDERAVRFAERIRIATESSFTVWEGDFRDFPEPETQDVVLALGAFRQLIEGSELDPGLREFLGRLSAEVMVAGLDSRADAELVARGATMASVEALPGPAAAPTLYRLTS